MPDVEDSRGSLMVYTSGTTGRPKGVVHTHGSARSRRCGAWSRRGRGRRTTASCCTLPLHHVHGIVNVHIMCAVVGRGVRRAARRSTPHAVWERLASGDLTLFMAVPTIYRA